MNSISYNIDYHLNKADVNSIEKHLLSCDSFFEPPLSSYINIQEYSKKLFCKAINFEAWSEDRLIGLISVYLNDIKSKVAYISNVSFDLGYHNRGIASALLSKAIAYSVEKGFQSIKLDVFERNTIAINLYLKMGFKKSISVSKKQTMIRFF